MRNKQTSGMSRWLVVAKIRALFMFVFFCVAVFTVSKAQTIKVIDAGGGGDYTSLNAATIDIKTGVLTGDVELQIASDLTETILDTIYYRPALTSLKIYPTGSARTITAPTLRLLTISNPNVTIDGSLNGTGTGPASLYIRTNPATTMANNNNLINITGVSATPSTNIVIKYCNIYDFANGIMLNSYTGVTIDHNSFYSTRDSVSNGLAQQNCIIMAGASITCSDSIIISNNYFGGSAPLAEGRWLRTNVATGSSTNNWGFYAMYLRANASVTLTHKIRGNVIRNVYSGVQTAGGKGIYGIYFRSANAGNFDITGNSFSDMTYGNDASNSNTSERYIMCIWINGTGRINFSNNEIYNLDNRGVQTTNNNPITAGVVIGGNWDSGTAKGTLIINNNNIHDLKSLNISNGGANGNVPTNVNITAGIIGVLAHNAITIDGNKVYNISNYNSGAYPSPVVGIQVKTSADATFTLNNIRNNIVYNLSTASTQPSATAPYIIGLGITSGNANCYNNAVSIGEDAQGGAVVGILKYTDAATSNSKFYHNTVYVGGTVTLTSSERKSYAFLRLGAFNPTTSDIAKNNIFYNVRSGSVSHFAIGLPIRNNMGFTSNNNELYSGIYSNLGTVTALEKDSIQASLDFAGWQTAVAGDAMSKNVPVNFAGTASANLRSGSPQMYGAGETGLGITNDILNITRPSPPSIGAYEVFSVTSINVFGQGGVSNIPILGSTLQMLTKVLPVNASDSTIIWSVADGTGHATISPNGLLTASSFGTVIVTASAHDLSGISGHDTILIGKYAESINVTGAGGATTITVNGATLQMLAEVLPADAYNKNVSWSITSGEDLAIISSGGILTPIFNGPVTVRAAATDGSGIYGTCIIIISNQAGTPVSSITVNGADGDSIVIVGGTLQMIANVLPLNAYNKTVTWSVTNLTGQATISASGLLTAAANGMVRVTATANDGSGVTGQKDIKITNQLPATIIVSNDLQTSTNAVGKVVMAQASETPGRIYLVYSSAPQANILELEAARKIHKAAYGIISAINTNVSIPTDSLVPGTYNVYATDLTYNRSVNASSNTITITDGLPPIVNCELQTLTNAAGKSAKVQSTEPTGNVFVILDGVPQTTLTDLNAAVAASNGAKAIVSIANIDVSINVFNLAPGTYYAYAVDEANNVSLKSTNSITIADGIPPIATASAQTQKNGIEKTVNVQSNEPVGKVYIILSGLAAANLTVTSLDSIVALKKGASATVTAANTYIPVGTYGLELGKYVAYAIDGNDNVSLAGTNIINIIDGIPPIAALANSVIVSNAPGQFVKIRSNETPCGLFLILSGSVFSTYADLEAIVEVGNGAFALSMEDDSVAVPTNGCNPGIYYAYAVDNERNISEKSLNSVTVIDYTGIPLLSGGVLKIYVSEGNIVLDLSTSAPQRASVEVYSLMGHKLGYYSLYQGKNTIYTNAKGICIVKASIGKQVVVTKLILP
jgi:uncharacterized protein YjdB